MKVYHIIMISLLALSIFLLIVLGFIKGKNLQVCTVKKDTSGKSDLNDNDLLHISEICKLWYKASKLWCCVHYCLAMYSAAASIITIYIATTPNFSQEDVVLYSIFALVSSMASLILRCETKSNVVRGSYNKMQAALYMYKIGKLTEEDIIKCFDECEKKITEFYI